MGLDQSHDHKVATSSTPDNNSHPLDGIWTKPSSTADSTTSLVDTKTTSPTDIKGPDAQTKNPRSSQSDGKIVVLANEKTAPVFTDSDGAPVSAEKVAGMTYTGFQNKSENVQLVALALPKLPGFENDVTNVSDRAHLSDRAAHKTGNRATAEDLSKAAHDAIGSDKYGNKVPSSAAENSGFDVPKNLKCAATSSEWLVQIGMISNRDFKIKVDDMVKLLPEKGFTKVPLSGADFDASKFPDGPIGFITGRRKFEDGSNHIGYIEKRDGEVHVIHNDYHTGKVIDQNITEKFYTADGKPAYRDLNMFIFPKK